MAAPRDDETNGQDPGGGDGGGGGLGGSGEGRSPREDTPPAPCAAFCGPRSCSTLPPSLSPQQAQPPQPQAPVSTEPKRRRLWGLRGLVKMFRRRVRRRADESVSPQPPQPTLRARSTSELAVDIQHSRNSGPYNQGLSVSHDSVFSPDTSTDGHHPHNTPPALAIASRGVNMAELKAVLRRRRGDDSVSVDDDPGLPRSPPTSPTTLDVLNHGLKSSSRATHSTCSDGSLLSMGSSENDEDSLGIGSHHSSKVSLLEGRHQVVASEAVRPSYVPQRKSNRTSFVSDSILDGREVFLENKDNEPVAGAAPLSHQAALHKISIRPRRTHGAPRSRRATQIAGQMSLPATPEVNEEANSKNATTPKSSVTTALSPAAITPPQESAIPQPIVDEQIRQESPIGSESQESEKKEDKRDEPLLQRLFGSVRSGRRRSRGNGDESRENSVSPMRRGGDQRTSREKRRDSSGSRFPVLGRSSTKSRQESHPLPPSGKSRDQSRERSKHDVSPPSPQTPRSASVEGRLETTTTPTSSQNVFRVSSYEDRTSRHMEGVRKVKSFRETHSTQQEVVHSKIITTTSQMNTEESVDLSLRKTESVESLEGDTRTSSSRTISSSGVTDVSASPHRSVDSLTSTSLPGVFIRPQPQTQYKVYKHKHPDQQLSAHQKVPSGQDVSSGPLSLDSSITLQSREPEDLLRKASSVSHVGYSVESQRANVANDASDANDMVGKKVMDAKSGSKVIMIEEKSESKPKESKKYPGSAIQTEPVETVTRERSSDGEVDGESLRRRSLKKEPSLKRILSRDSDSSPVPEFMRIQLNKVENKGHSVIYDTDQEKHPKTDGNQDALSAKTDEMNLVNSLSDKSLEDISNNSMMIEQSNIIIESKSEKSRVKKSNSKVGKAARREVSPSGSTLEKRDHDSGVEGSSPEPTIDRVILRKPLVSERAPVMERACSVTSQVTPSPTKSDQPELFKVFARRSFKVKDSDKEKFHAVDSDEDENIEASSEVSEVTITSTRAPDSSLSASDSGGTGPTAQSSVQGLQKSSINAISFNRKSVGNPTLSFCPPPITNLGTPPLNSPLSQKPTVLILSSSSSSSTTSVSTVTSVSNTSVVSSSVTSRASVHSVQVTGSRLGTATPEAVTVSETAETVSTSPQPGITSKIINSRIISKSATAGNESTSGDELESSPTPPSVTPTPMKTTRSGSGLVWPPRPLLEDSPHGRRLSCSPSLDIEGSRTPLKTEGNQDPVEISPLDIGAARRRFMSGGKDTHSSPTPPLTLGQTTSVSPASPSVQSSGSPASTTSRTGALVTEARNAAPSFTITVRTQPAPSDQTTASDTSSSELNTSTASNSSIGKTEQGTGTSPAAEDWRVLVRQRREGRLKQTKTPDSEEIIIETRPPVSRNSKVLEMANNFQKLQVA